MYIALLGVQYMSILLLILESGYIFMKWKSRLQSYLLFNCVATLVNNVGYLFEMLAKTEEGSLMGKQMSYLGRVWIPYSLLLFTLALCKVKTKRRVLMGLGFVHIITYVMVLTSQWQSFYYTSLRYVKTGIFPHLEYGYGIWHIIYSVLIVIYIVYGLTRLVQATYKEKNPIARKRLQIMVLAIAIESGFYIMQLLKVGDSYDVTVLGYTVATVFMYVAIFKYSLLDTLQLAKDYVMDEVTEGIIAVNEVGGLEYCNESAKKIFPDIEERINIVVEKITDALEKKEPIKIEEKIYLPEKKLLMQNGMGQGNLYMLVDDTEHYRYIKELREQKEIAEEANASKSSFLSVVTHEIRTPMNAVVGMTELLLREPEKLTDKQEKYLKNIHNSGQALVMIVNDILDQSKIEAGKMEIIEEPYELRPMADDVKMIIENRIGSKPVHLIYEIDTEIPRYLSGDSLRIRQILINLMNNAVKFTEEGYIKLGVRCIASEKDRKLIKFSVKDSGQGIRPEDLEKLGKAFTQIDTKKNHSKEGTGLGLSISRDFIEMMGGKLSVESEYGAGTEFSFAIWQDVAEGIEKLSPSGVNKQAWQEEEQFTAPEAKVLIVDDTELNRLITTELLKPLEMNVGTAASGEKALEMVEREKYDVIFMDYLMPSMDGAETTKKIRTLAMEYDNDEAMQAYLKSVPIIALTGDGSEETKEKFLRAGMDDFTEKPVELKRLKHLLLKWLPENKIKN